MFAAAQQRESRSASRPFVARDVDKFECAIMMRNLEVAFHLISQETEPDHEFGGGGEFLYDVRDRGFLSDGKRALFMCSPAEPMRTPLPAVNRQTVGVIFSICVLIGSCRPGAPCRPECEQHRQGAASKSRRV